MVIGSKITNSSMHDRTDHEVVNDAVGIHR